MRIAVTGTHGTGKTTLVEDLAAACSGHEIVPEPHWLLDGDAFVDGAITADLEEQLAKSCALILGTAGNRDVIFDRSPLDFLAYLDVVSAAEGFEWVPDPRVLARIVAALETLELIVFVPLVRPDQIRVAIEHPRLRRRVDARLKAMLRGNELALPDDGPRVLEVRGGRRERVARVLALMARPA